MSGKKPHVNVLCDLVRRKEYEESFDISPDVLRISCDAEAGNVYLRPGELEDWLGRPLQALSRDLAEVAAYIYEVDKSVKRGEGDSWTRSISMLIPVRRSDLWGGLSGRLARTMFELTGDDFTFHFVQSRQAEPKSPASGAVEATGAEAAQADESDCTCLFSGGLDSFVGAAELVRRGRRPALVSHYISNLRPVQEGQVRGINDVFGSHLEHFQYRVAPQNLPGKTKYPLTVRDNNQRARSFLYLSMAALIAFERGLTEVFICENGVMAVNLPMTFSRLGSRSTRSANPNFLEEFQATMRELFGARLTIRNPFLLKTKKEMVETVTEGGLKKLMKQTISCWGYPRRTMGVPGTNHCGYCLPCIHRRIAFIAPGATSWDDNYKVDVFKAYAGLSAEQAQDFRDLLTFASGLERRSEGELISEHAGLLVSIGDLCDTDGEVDAVLLARMYRRYASEVLGVTRKRAPGALKLWGIQAAAEAAKNPPRP